MFEYYNRMYNVLKLLSKNDLAIAVALNNGDLTAEQYKTITGENYVEPTVNSILKDLQINIEKVKVSASLSGGLSSSRMDGIEEDIAALKGGA